MCVCVCACGLSVIGIRSVEPASQKIAPFRPRPRKKKNILSLLCLSAASSKPARMQLCIIDASAINSRRCHRWWRARRLRWRRKLMPVRFWFPFWGPLSCGAGWLAAGDPGAIKTAGDGLKSTWRFGEWHAGAFPKPPYPCSQRAPHLN